jgi:hypothetical protein
MSSRTYETIERLTERLIAHVRRSIRQEMHHNKFKHEYEPGEIERLDREAAFWCRKRTDAPD